MRHHQLFRIETCQHSRSCSCSRPGLASVPPRLLSSICICWRLIRVSVSLLGWRAWNRLLICLIWSCCLPWLLINRDIQWIIYYIDRLWSMFVAIQLITVTSWMVTHTTMSMSSKLQMIFLIKFVCMRCSMTWTTRGFWSHRVIHFKRDLLVRQHEVAALKKEFLFYRATFKRACYFSIGLRLRNCGAWQGDVWVVSHLLKFLVCNIHLIGLQDWINTRATIWTTLVFGFIKININGFTSQSSYLINTMMCMMMKTGDCNTLSMIILICICWLSSKIGCKKLSFKRAQIDYALLGISGWLISCAMRSTWHK